LFLLKRQQVIHPSQPVDRTPFQLALRISTKRLPGTTILTREDSPPLISPTSQPHSDGQQVRLKHSINKTLAVTQADFSHCYTTLNQFVDLVTAHLPILRR
jgi:hypothetical protein